MRSVLFWIKGVAMIKLTGIEKIYQTQKMETLALSNINLNVDKGQFISVMGPPSSG